MFKLYCGAGHSVIYDGCSSNDSVLSVELFAERTLRATVVGRKGTCMEAPAVKGRRESLVLGTVGKHTSFSLPQGPQL